MFNKKKGRMKKLLIALSAAALLAGCASQNNGMSGTSDEDTTQSQGTVQSQDTMKTDAIHSTQNGGSLNSNSDTSGTRDARNSLDGFNVTPPPQ